MAFATEIDLVASDRMDQSLAGVPDLNRIVFALSILGHGDGQSVQSVAQQEVFALAKYRDEIIVASRLQSHAQSAVTALAQVEEPILRGRDLEMAKIMLDDDITMLDLIQNQMQSAIAQGDENAAALIENLRRVERMRLVKMQELDDLIEIEVIAYRYEEAVARAFRLNNAAQARLKAAHELLDLVASAPLSPRKRMQLHATLGVPLDAAPDRIISN